MTWLYEKPESVLRVTRELEQEVQMLLLYLAMKGKSIASRDKKRIEERIKHILYAELPHSPYTGNH
jgi:hypothetical protein